MQGTIPNSIILQDNKATYETDVHIVYEGESPPNIVQDQAILSIHLGADYKVQQILPHHDQFKIKDAKMIGNNLIIQTATTNSEEENSQHHLVRLIEDFNNRNKHIAHLLDTAKNEEIYAQILFGNRSSDSISRKKVPKAEIKEVRGLDLGNLNFNYGMDEEDVNDKSANSPKRPRTYSTPPKQNPLASISTPGLLKYKHKFSKELPTPERPTTHMVSRRKRSISINERKPDDAIANNLNKPPEWVTDSQHSALIEIVPANMRTDLVSISREGSPTLNPQCNLVSPFKEFVPNLCLHRRVLQMKLTPALISEEYPGQSLQEITELQFTNRGISELEDISPLVELKKLDLSENEISSIAAIVFNRQLQWLSLKKNHIKAISKINKLKQLKVLNLSHNKIKIVSDINELENLQALVLNNNKILSIKDLFLLKNLNTIVLSHNRLESLDGIEKLKNLKKISSTNNKIALFPEKASVKFQWGLQLTELRLSHNLLTSIPTSLSYLPILKILDLGHNVIADYSSFPVLSTMKALRHLSLIGNPVNTKDDYSEKIREFVPTLYVLDARRIDNRKKAKYHPKRKKNPDDSNDQPPKKKKKTEENEEKPVSGPLTIRGRVSTAKKINFDDNGKGSASNEADSNASEKKEKKKKEENKKEKKEQKSPKKKEKEEGNEEKEGKKEKEQDKEVEKRKEQKLKSISGVKAVEVIKKGKKSDFSFDALLETESIGTGKSQW